MLASQVFLRTLLRDRIFVVLLGLCVITFLLAVTLRHPSIETTPLPFELGLFFFICNCVFAFLTVRREPLLSYMFLTIAILNNATLGFFFRYLLLIQAS